MKKILFLIASLWLSHTFAQYAYPDVQSLKALNVGNRYLDSGIVQLPDKEEVYQVLKYYVAPADSSSKDSIAKRFSTNPFMRWDMTAISHGALSGGGVKSLMSKAGGLDITNIANGVADFMIERAKEELTIAFFNRFRKFSKENPEFGTLFPVTNENLANLLAYRYAEMLPVLRSGFIDDLDKLTYHLDDVLELPKYRLLLKRFPEVRIAIRSIRLVHELERNEINVAEVLDRFAAFDEWTEDSVSTGLRNMGNSLKFAAIFSNSLRQNGSGKIWARPAEIKAMIQDKGAFTMYLGLVYQITATQKIVFTENKQTIFFTTVLKKQKENFFVIQNKVEEFISLADRVEKQLNAMSGKEPDREDYYNYIQTAIDVMEYGFGIASVFDDRVKAKDYTQMARKANELYKNVFNKEYPQAVINSLGILNQAFNLAKENPRYAAIPAADKKNIEKLETFLNKVTKYGLFMANMAIAKSSDEVKAALQSATLPVGSSSIKKNTAFNIAVQSYLGAYSAIGPYDKKNYAWNDRFGVMAPIGLSISHGFGRAGSISLFPTLFDLGAVVDYRLSADSVSTASGAKTQEVKKEYKIQLGQLVSPGCYLVYGLLGNFPLSLGIGGQYGPGLAKIEAGGKTNVVNPSWRWNVFLSVDIPFFNLCSVRKK